MSSLVTYEPYVDECADLISQRLVELSHGGLHFDLRHWLQCYAFDVIGSITYSKRLGFLDRGVDVEGVMKAIGDMMVYASIAGVYAFVHPYIFPLKNFLAGSKGMGRTYVQSFTKDCVEEHQSSPKVFDFDAADDGKATDFLTKFYAQHTRSPDSFTTTHILVACVQNMVCRIRQLQSFDLCDPTSYPASYTTTDHRTGCWLRYSWEFPLCDHLLLAQNPFMFATTSRGDRSTPGSGQISRDERNI